MVKSLRFGIVLIGLLLCTCYYLFNVHETFTPILSNLDNTTWLEERLTNYFKEPVHIDDSTLSWRGFFHPYLELKNFSISSKEGTEKLHIARLQFGIDLMASILNGKITPGDITFEGSKIVLREEGHGLLSINNIHSLEADFNNKHSEKLDTLINMFLSSGTKTIKNVDLLWFDQNGHLVLPLTKINVTTDSHLFFHSFLGSAAIWHNQSITYNGQIYGSYILKKSLFTKIKTSIDHADVKNNPLLQRYLDRFNIQQGVVSLALDFESNYRSTVLKGNILANKLSLIDKSSKTIFPEMDIATAYHLWAKQNNFSLSLTNLQLKLQNKLLPLHRLQVTQDTNSKGQRLKLNVDLFPIKNVSDCMSQYHLLSPKLEQIVNEMHPSGLINNFVLQLNKQNLQNDERISFSGDLTKVSVSAWQHFPGVQNFTGKIQFTPLSGDVWINSSDTILDLPHVFRAPITTNTLTGHVSWFANKKHEWLISSKDLSVATTEGRLSGALKLLLPSTLSNPKIYCKTNFNMNNVANAAKYFPVTIMPKSVVAWLDKSIKSGQLKNGVVILNGRLKEFPFDSGNGKFKITGDLSNGVLHYKDHWPDVTNLDAKLLFEGRSMKIISNKAKILGAKITAVTADIVNLEKAVLALHGQVTTSPKQSIVLSETTNPLAQYLNYKILNNLLISGELQLGLSLLLPLNNERKHLTHYNGKVDLHQVKIKSQTSPFILNKLTGNFQFSNDRATTKLLTGEIMSHPFIMTIAADEQINQSVASELNVDSTISIADLQKFFTSNLLRSLQGDLLYHANLKRLHNISGQNQYTLQINSNLQGIKSELPAPFTKTTTDIWPTTINLIDNKNVKSFSIQLGEMISGVFNFDNSFKKGNLHFGMQKAILPSTDGLIIDGQLPEFNGSSWKKVIFSDYHKNNSSWLKHINKINLTFDQFNIFDLTFQNLTVKSFKQNNNFICALANNKFAGEIKVPTNYPVMPINANFSNLVIPADQKKLLLQPKDIPALDLNFVNLKYHDKHIQNLALKLRPSENNLLIKQLQINEPGLAVSATGTWRTNQNNQETHLEGDLYSQNFGAFLNQWHITDNVVKGDGAAKFNISWHNSPMAPEAKSLSGYMDLNFKKGRIINLGSQVDLGMGIGRLLNVLSLQTIPRRLKGDFSDLTESGYSFDDLSGNLQFKEGNIYTDDATLDGIVGKVKISGRIGLVQKDYNLRLKINPNVTSSLPLVATLTAGPIVGAATWLVDKVFSRQVKKFTEIHYNVTGTWDNPNMHNVSN